MDIVLRIAIIFVFLFVTLRVIGKREFGQLSPFEFVTLLMISEILTEALSGGETSLTGAVIGVTTLLMLVFLTSLVAYLSRTLGSRMEGEPVLLVQHGSLVPSALHRERVSPQEILAEMHKAGLERMEDVKWGILEVDGKISFVGGEPALARREAGRDTVVG